jgi:hypothetical protein
VVGVPSAVVPHGHPDVLGNAGEAPDELLHAFLLEVGLPLDGPVDVIDVSLVMFRVMDLHGARVDVGLERIIGIRQLRQFVGHWILLGKALSRNARGL